MSAKSTRIKITGRSALTAIGVVVVVIAWVLAFYLPQTHKLQSLDSKQTTLQATLTADQARLLQLQKEAQHVTEIRAMYNRLNGYAPATGKVYTYIHTISHAAKSAGVTITSLQPGALQAVNGTTYSAIQITASIKGTYDSMLSFIKGLYNLPRLTDVNAINVTGGGPGTNRGTVLAVTLELAIFTSQKPAGAA